MHRFLINNIFNNTVEFSSEISHQITSVLKLKPHTNVIIICANKFYLASIQYNLPKKVSAQIITEINENHESPIEITLIMGLIREQKWDFCLQKVTELGVKRIVPMEFTNCVVKNKKASQENKKKRWEKICIEAAEQSYRNFVPEIIDSQNKLIDLVKFKSELNFVGHEKQLNIHNFKKQLHNDTKNITIVVGPEGGLTNEEINFFIQEHFNIISLGKRILRAETAAIMFLSALSFQYEL